VQRSSNRGYPRHLTELQGLLDDGLLVVTKATAETNGSRDDDRASYKDTHGLSPIRSVCMGTTIYAFARESCDTWDTAGGEKMGCLAANPFKKGAGRR
jgi:hypothetical protein